jgi:hypothetical protein
MNIKDLTLTKPAYIDGLQYTAHATDNQGNEYMVHWEIKEFDENVPDDESEMCDWDNPTFITKL